MKLAMIALLVHPIMILMPTGLFAGTNWGLKAENNPGAHGFSEILYQFSSSSANNGSAFDGLGVTYGFNNNPNPAPMARQWDIASGLVIIISRFLPIIAPMVMAAFLGAKKSSPFGLGTLRDDTPTFAFLLDWHDRDYWRAAVPSSGRFRSAGGTLGSASRLVADHAAVRTSVSPQD